jgi:hypothetical protein
VPPLFFVFFVLTKMAFSEDYKIFKKCLILMSLSIPKETLDNEKKTIINRVTIHSLLSLFGVRSFSVVYKFLSI